MGIDDGELLVIVSSEPTGRGVEVLPERFPIVHAVSSRVFVIALPADGRSAELAALPGIASVSRSGPDSEILDGLDEMETLFVRAWSRRKEEFGARRRGEGLDWDANGFEPPDPPPETELDG